MSPGDARFGRCPRLVIRPRLTAQRGSGTLLSLTVVVFLLALTGGVSVFGRYIVERHRAEAAADLAALAGAQVYGKGRDGCATAGFVATDNGGHLTDCSVVGDRVDFVLSVRVEAVVPVRVPMLPAKVAVQAFAGPVR